jgi:thiol-disulfide isomerase/thioredoxin
MLAACAGSDPGGVPADAGGQATANPTSAVTQPAATPTAEPTATPIPLPTRRPATPAPRLGLQYRIPIREVPLTLFSGETLRLSDLQGQVVVMNFWASWCGPCVAEMPAFERVYNEYRDRGVTFLGIDTQDRELAARAFVDRIGVTYPLTTDETGRLAVEFEVIEANGVFLLPSTVFLDRNGRPVGKFAGAINESVLRGLIEAMLDQG